MTNRFSNLILANVAFLEFCRAILKYIGIKKSTDILITWKDNKLHLIFFWCANASETTQLENAQIAHESVLESEIELSVIQHSMHCVHYLLVICCILFIMWSCQTVSSQSENLDILQSIQSLERTISQSILEASWIMFPSAHFQHFIFCKCKWKLQWSESEKNEVEGGCYPLHSILERVVSLA